MAVYRYSGHLVGPNAFRIDTGGVGTVVSADIGELENRFSRKGETANLEAVRQQHSSVAEHYDSRNNQAIFITNNSDYIFRLNNGWSSQTPAGFFERALQDAVKAIRGVWRFGEAA
jgi:hypothetical protein